MRNYEQALRTSVKLQEEAGRWWTTMLNQTASAQDWQKRMTNITSMANGVMPVAQRRMEEVMELMEKNSRTGADLVKKAVEAARPPRSQNASPNGLMFGPPPWTWLERLEALTQINSRVIDSWIDFARKNTEVTEVRVDSGFAGEHLPAQEESMNMVMSLSGRWRADGHRGLLRCV